MLKVCLKIILFILISPLEAMEPEIAPHDYPFAPSFALLEQAINNFTQITDEAVQPYDPAITAYLPDPDAHLISQTGFYTCVLCRAKFKTQEAARQHSLFHINPKLYQCTNCLRTFNHITRLDEHYQYYHSQKSQRSQYTYFCGAADLTGYVKKSNPKQKCLHCNRHFKSKRGADRHMLIIHAIKKGSS